MTASASRLTAQSATHTVSLNRQQILRPPLPPRIRRENNPFLMSYVPTHVVVEAFIGLAYLSGSVVCLMRQDRSKPYLVTVRIVSNLFLLMLMQDESALRTKAKSLR